MSLDMLFNMFHKLKLMTAHGKITKNKTEIVNYLSVAQCTYNKDNINKTKTTYIIFLYSGAKLMEESLKIQTH